jgi:hypothetical protein
MSDRVPRLGATRRAGWWADPEHTAVLLAAATGITALVIVVAAVLPAESDQVRSRPARPAERPAAGVSVTRASRSCVLLADQLQAIHSLVFVPTPAARGRLIARLRVERQELEATMPSTLAPDMDALDRTLDRLYAATEANNLDFTNLPPDVFASLNSRELNGVFERAKTYLNGECDIDLDGGVLAP